MKKLLLILLVLLFTASISFPFMLDIYLKKQRHIEYEELQKLIKQGDRLRDSIDSINRNDSDWIKWEKEYKNNIHCTCKCNEGL